MVTAIDVVDEGADGRHVAAATMTCAVLDHGAMVLEFERPVMVPMPSAVAGSRRPRGFLLIEPGEGPATRMVLDDRLRNPWGILHGGAVAMLADEGPCRGAADWRGAHRPHGVAAARADLHYLRPVKVGPCRGPGYRAGHARRTGPWCG